MVTDSRTLHHYWSHTDVSPWSADGSIMLSQRADVSGMQDLLEGTRTRLHQDIGFTNFTTGSARTTVAVRAALHAHDRPSACVEGCAMAFLQHNALRCTENPSCHGLLCITVSLQASYGTCASLHPPAK